MTTPKPPIAIVSLEWDVVDLVESIGTHRILGFFDASPECATRDFRYLGTDDALLVAAQLAAWAAWIRSNIHERGHAPAPPAGGAGGPAATPQAAGGGGTPGQAPAGDGRPGGASHGKKAHNPN